HSAIRYQSLSGYPTSVCRSQKSDNIGNVTGLTQTSQSRFAYVCLFLFFRQTLLQHFGERGAGGDGIYRDLSFAKILCPCSRKRIQSSFTGGVKTPASDFGRRRY